jgi:hypothetical protein
MFTCFSAPGIEFKERSQMVAHMKTEWHRYNTKRKEASLAAVTEDEFEKRKAEMLAKQADIERNGQGHVKPAKREKAAQ